MASRSRLREPGISSSITRAVLEELESRGIASGPLLKRAGLERSSLVGPDAWISQRRHAGFYRSAIAASGDPAFGVAVGRRAPLQFTRIAGHCAAVSKDLREAFGNWGRYCELVGEGTHFGTNSAPDHDAVHWRRLPALPSLHDDELSFAASLMEFHAFATGQVAKPIEVRLSGPAPARPEAVVRALGVPVRWGTDHFEIRLSPGTLDLPIRFSDPGLRATLEHLARQEVAMRRGESASERARAAILRIGFDQSAAVAAVAAALGTTGRTLQRWLADEGSTFSQVRIAALRDAAKEMLGEEDAQLADVAFRLGFSSRSGFHRAIRRWTGKTPAELRRKSGRSGHERGRAPRK